MYLSLSVSREWPHTKTLEAHYKFYGSDQPPSQQSPNDWWKDYGERILIIVDDSTRNLRFPIQSLP